MPVDICTSRTMYKTAAVFVISAIAIANCHDLVAGHRVDGRKIFDEKFEASPAIWRQDNNVTINATEGEVISRIVVTDLRETKDADVQIVNGNIGDKSVTIELKSPTVFRGYEFKIEVYALPESTDNLGRSDSPIPPALSGNLQPGTRFEDNDKSTTEDESHSNLPRTNVNYRPGDLEKEILDTSDTITDSTVEMSSTTPVNQLRKGRETQDDIKNPRDISKDTPSFSEHPRNLGEMQPSNNPQFATTDSLYTNANTQKDKEYEYATTTMKNARNGRDTIAKENNTGDSEININTSHKPASLKDMESSHTIKMRDTSSKDSKYPGQSTTTEPEHAFNPAVIPLNHGDYLFKDNKQNTTEKHMDGEKDDDDVKSTGLINMDSDDKIASSTIKNDNPAHPRHFRDTENDEAKVLPVTMKDQFGVDNSQPSTESNLNVTPYVYIHRATETNDKTTNPQKTASNSSLKPIISLQ